MSIITESGITVANMVNLLSSLPKGTEYPYINASTHTVVTIEEIIQPYGPITIKRWDPTKSETKNTPVNFNCNDESCRKCNNKRNSH